MNKKFVRMMILLGSLFFFIFSGIWGVGFILTKETHYLITVGINMFTATVLLILYIYKLRR
jgi:hypothetical protein